MPVMPRPNGPKLMRRGKSIAFSILGIPPNMQRVKNTMKQKYIDKRLLDEETTRMR
jgi:hypothetical protein